VTSGTSAQAITANELQQRFRTFLTTAVILGFGVGVSELIAGIFFSFPSLIYAGLVILVHIFLAFLVWLSIGRRPLNQLAVLDGVINLSLAACAIIPTPFAMPVCLLLIILIPISVMPYVNSHTLRVFSLVCGFATPIIFLIGTTTNLVPLPPILFQELFSGIAATAIIALCLLLIWQYHGRLNETLNQLETANTELQQSQATLEGQVATRTANLQEALAKQEEYSEQLAQALVRQQELDAEVEALTLPIIPVRADTLVVPLVGVISKNRATQLLQHVLSQIETHRAMHLIFDVTGVPIVDTAVAATLLQAARAARLLGTQTMLVGIRPDVAQALVSLGVELAEITTYATLQEALEQILRGNR
jgi:rsbT co-antagonist protein RsbR